MQRNIYRMQGRDCSGRRRACALATTAALLLLLALVACNGPDSAANAASDGDQDSFDAMSDSADTVGESMSDSMEYYEPTDMSNTDLEPSAEAGEDETDAAVAPSLFIRIRPQSAGQAQLFSIPNPPPPQVALSIDPSVEVAGYITDGAGQPVKGRIVFEPVQDASLPALLAQGAVTTSVSASDGFYKASLIPSAYNVYIYPTYPDMWTLPPFKEANSLLVGLDAVTRDYSLADSTVAASGIVLTDDKALIDGLSIRALDETRGLSSPELTLTSASTFTLYLPAVDKAVYTIEVSGRSSEKPFVAKRRFIDAIMVTMEQDPERPNLFLPKVQFRNHNGAPVDNLILDYTGLPKGRCEVRGRLWTSERTDFACNISVMAGGQNDCALVSNFLVSASGEAAYGEFFRSAIVSDSTDGRFSLAVMPGFYHLLASPADGETAAMSLLDLDCAPESYAATEDDVYYVTIDYTLPQRGVLTGTIVDADGAPVKGVEVYATLTRSEPLQISRVYTTLTDAQGAYALRLDPGDYLVELLPPLDSALGRGVVSGLRIDATGQRLLDYKLTEGLLLEGTVTQSVSKNTGVLLVEVLLAPGDGSVLTLGQTVANGEGAFSLRLPSGLMTVTTR